MRQNGQILPQNEEDRDLFCLFHISYGLPGVVRVHEDFGNLMDVGIPDIGETAFTLVLLYETGADDTGGDRHGTDTEISDADRHDPPQRGDGIDISVPNGEQR